jgi:transcriptional regulator GlxA family with amidase domain
VLDGLRATSNKAFFSLATSQSDRVNWAEQARWVEDGKVFTSSGVSAGTDMALAVVQRLFGEPRAVRLAEQLEYQWHREADQDPFVRLLQRP